MCGLSVKSYLLSVSFNLICLIPGENLRRRRTPALQCQSNKTTIPGRLHHSTGQLQVKLQHGVNLWFATSSLNAKEQSQSTTTISNTHKQHM